MELDGVESFYVTHDRMQVDILDDACRAFDLLSAGSSDFHGPDHAIFPAFRRHALHDLEPNLGAIPSFAGPIRPCRKVKDEDLEQG